MRREIPLREEVGLSEVDFQVKFVVSNQEGKVMVRIQEQKQQDQFVLNTTSYLTGCYICNLFANGLFSYSEPILLPELTKSKLNSKKYDTGTIQPEVYFKLFPNPANQYVIIEFSLIGYPNQLNDIIFVITNQDGKVVDKVQVHKRQDQFFQNTSGFLPGTYICNLFINGRILEGKKFVIIK